MKPHNFLRPDRLCCVCRFVYSFDAGWIFYGDEHKAAPQSVQDAISGSEAIDFRSNASLLEDGEVLEFERLVRRGTAP